MPNSAEEIYEALRAPIGEKDVTFRAVVVSTDGTKAIFAPRIRKEAAVARLNDLIGPNWNCRYRPSQDSAMPGVFCELSVLIGNEWITREGADHDVALSASCAAAFSAAAQSLGIGGELEGLFTDWIELDELGQPRQYLSLAKTQRRSQAQPIAKPPGKAAADTTSGDPLDSVWTVGKKYSGLKLRDIPLQYWEWALNTSEGEQKGMDMLNPNSDRFDRKKYEMARAAYDYHKQDEHPTGRRRVS